MIVILSQNITSHDQQDWSQPQQITMDYCVQRVRTKLGERAFSSSRTLDPWPGTTSQQTFKQYQTLPVSNNLSRLTILGSLLMCI